MFILWLWPSALCDMALFHLLLFRYCFGVAWGVTVSLGNSSTVSASYYNSTTTSLTSRTTVSQTTRLSEVNTTAPQTTTFSVPHHGPYLSSGFATSATVRGSGYEVLPMTDRKGNTTIPSTAAYSLSNTAAVNSTATKTIQSTGSGFAYASSCESFTRDWWSTSSKWFSSNSYSSIAVNTILVTTTLYSESVVPITRTSCLGHSREIGGQTLAQSSTGETVFSMLYSYLTPVPSSSYSVPMPTCAFDTDSCNTLWDEYDAYWSLAAEVWPAAPTITRVPEPMCSPYRPNAHCHKCTIEGNWADVYYWPMEAVGEPCDPSRSFITAAPTIPGQPNTMVFGTDTFTSPTVYVSVDWLKALDTKGSYCGGQYSSTFLPLRPEDISSIRFSAIDKGYTTDYFTFDQGTTTEYETIAIQDWEITATATVPVFFGDFMGAVPAAAYSAQSPVNLYPGAPTTDGVISDAKYSPRIVLPERIRSMDPYWSNCVLDLHGISDPPVALTAASTVVKPALPTWTTTVNAPVPSDTTPAEPAGQPDPPHASITQTATSQSRSSSTVGASQNGGPAEASRTSSRVNPSAASPPTDNQSPQGLPPQNPPVVVRPVTSVSGDQNSRPSDSPDPIVAPPNSGSPAEGQSITPVATSRQTPVIITLGSSRLPVVQSGSVAVVGDRTLTVGGSPIVIQGQQISLEPSGLRVESSETVNFSSAPTILPTNTAVWNDGGTLITVSQENNAVVLTSGTQTTTIAFGASAVVNGHRVDVPTSGGMLLIDGSEIVPITLEIPSSGSSILLRESSIHVSVPLEAGERAITVERLEDGDIRLTSGSETDVVANGASTVLAGSKITVLADGSGVVVSGTELIPLSDPPSERAGKMLADDSLFVLDGGKYVLIDHGGGTATLADGAVTVIDGHTISAAGDGGYVVVDGLVTRSVVASSTGVPEAEGGGSGVVEDAEATDAAVASGSVGPLISAAGIWGNVLIFSVLVGMMMI